MGFECWCCAAQRVAVLEGKIVGRRVACALLVTVCRCRDCGFRGGRGCLVGRELEGRWQTSFWMKLRALLSILRI